MRFNEFFRNYCIIKILPLSFQFLVGLIPAIKIKIPPPTHKARWMAKAISILILYIFHDKMDLNPEEIRAAHDLSQFICFLYAEIWFRGPFVADIAYFDLRLRKLLDTYQRFEIV